MSSLDCFFCVFNFIPSHFYLYSITICSCLKIFSCFWWGSMGNMLVVKFLIAIKFLIPYCYSLSLVLIKGRHHCLRLNGNLRIVGKCSLRIFIWFKNALTCLVLVKIFQCNYNDPLNSSSPDEFLQINFN